MRIQDNPFYILQVNPWDTLEKINENAEERAFADEKNEPNYENARQMLISPAKRLAAEVSWFYSKNMDFVRLCDDLSTMEYSDRDYINDSEYQYDDERENLIFGIELLGKRYSSDQDEITEIILSLDANYREICTNDAVYALLDTINRCRREAGIVICKDFELCKKEVHGLLNDITTVIDEVLRECDDYTVVEFTNEIAARTIEAGEEYGIVIEKLIESYAIKFDSELKRYKEDIFNMVEDAADYTEPYELDELCDMTRDFDHMAQPIQLLLKDRGQSDLQKESVAVANKIRSLAIDYHNESGLTELSLLLLNLEIELFSELPDFYSKIIEDREILEDLSREAAEYNRIKEKFDLLDKNIVRKNGYEQSNAKYLKSRLNDYKLTVINYTKFTLSGVDVDSDKYKENVAIIAILYRRIANSCTWGELWAESLDYYNRALMWAEKSNDDELVDSIEKNIEGVKKTIEAEKQRIVQEEQAKRELYYTGEWGLIFKDRISMTPERICYKDCSIRVNEINQVAWGVVRKFTNGIPTGTDYNIDICTPHGRIYINTNKQVYGQLTDRLWKATVSNIIPRILRAFRDGRETGFSVNIIDTGVHYIEHNWFSKDVDRYYSWDQLKVQYYNGDMCLNNYQGKTVASVTMMAYNAHMLDAIINLAIKKHVKKLSDLL